MCEGNVEFYKNVYMKNGCPSGNQLHMTFDTRRFETAPFLQSKTHKP